MEAPSNTLYEYLLDGLYPRIHKYNLPPRQFFRDYIETYITRDLQQLLNVGDLQSFRVFLKMLAGRCGQRINLTSLGNDVGISHTTVKRWLSVLYASYIIVILEPHYKNFNKRLIKTPKIYFLDSGLLCYLLRIYQLEDLIYHSLIGGIFESFVISELLKNYYHHDYEPSLYFWNERKGNEIDIMIDQGESLSLPIEVKSSYTLSQHFFDNLNYWLNIRKNPQGKGCIIYAGNEWQKRKNVQVIPWYGVS